MLEVWRIGPCVSAVLWWVLCLNLWVLSGYAVSLSHLFSLHVAFMDLFANSFCIFISNASQ